MYAVGLGDVELYLLSKDVVFDEHTIEEYNSVKHVNIKTSLLEGTLAL